MSKTYEERDIINFAYWLAIIGVLATMFVLRESSICCVLFVPTIIIVILMANNRKKAMETKKKTDEVNEMKGDKKDE